ncbi:MAG: SbcC/MukB-like Walker B domain-containing protein, partial [Paludibacter sp.]
EDNKACPLCGSLHHPFAEGNTPSMNETDLKVKAITEIIAQIEKANLALALAEKDQQTITNALTRAEAALQITQNNINKIEADIKAEKAKEQLAVAEAEAMKVAVLDLLLPLGITELAADGLRELNENLKTRLKLWNENSEIKNSIDEIIRTLDTNIVTENALLAEAIKLAEEVVIGKTQIDNALNSILADRLEQFGDRNTDTEEKRLDDWLKTARTKQTQTQQKWSELSNNFNALITQINQLSKAITERKTPLLVLEKAFQLLLSKAEFITETAFIESKFNKVTREKLQTKALALDNKKVEILATKQERKTRLDSEEIKKLTVEPIEILITQSEEIAKIIDAAKERKVAISEQLKNNEEGKKRIGEIMLRIDLQKKDCVKWDGLSALIGSADGKKYRNFAQGLTFEIMVSHANKQLTKLTDRYLLVRDKSEPLNLNVIDNYQAGECRSTKNLSGGESFYVSLALALGLSSMSSKNVRVDSLFLDEGFGTLDEETLEIALQTLSSLRQDGKLIGVISHVSSLKDRINTKIEVVKGVGGNSIIVGHGCKSLS